MLRIGDFSMLSRICIRTLRYYDHFGLLEPAYTDEATNYRYYSESQLIQANRIEALRGMGISLGDIKQLLIDNAKTENVRSFLLNEYSKKQEEMLLLQEQTTRLNTAIKYFENESYHYHCNIVVKELPAQKVISIRRTIPSYKQEASLWQALSAEGKSQGISYVCPAYNVAIYHDKEFRESNIDVEIQSGIVGNYIDTGNATIKEIPGMLIASITIQGEYDFIREINSAVAQWIVENKYIFDGPMFNMYHVSPKPDTSPDDRVIEVCFPIKSILDSSKTPTGDQLS